jgi:hypothetical protein
MRAQVTIISVIVFMLSSGTIKSHGNQELRPPVIRFYTTLPEVGGSETKQIPAFSLYDHQLTGAVEVLELGSIVIIFPDLNGAAVPSLRLLLDISRGYRSPYTYSLTTFSLTTTQSMLLQEGMAHIAYTIDDRGETLYASLLPLDLDYDGVPDFRDSCPDTPAGFLVDTNGCSIEQLCPCEGEWRNHGDYINHLAKVLSEFKKEGIITSPQGSSILFQANQSECGRHSH